MHTRHSHCLGFLIVGASVLIQSMATQPWHEGCATPLDCAETTPGCRTLTKLQVVKTEGPQARRDLDPYPPLQPDKLRKRTYKRALARAQRHGFSWYKGQMLTCPITHDDDLKSNYVSSPFSTSERHCKKLPPSWRVACWNAGGLGYDEWMTYIANSDLEIVVIQETHWKLSRAWTDHGWHLFHSAAPYAGVLIMIKTTIVPREQIAMTEHIPGRLLELTIFGSTVVHVFGVYQKSFSSAQADCLTQRALVWETVDDCLQHVPRRHLVYLLGDWNTSLLPDAGLVGPTQPPRKTARQPDASVFHSLLRSHQLIVLNTWHAWEHTYAAPPAFTRIDFILTRSWQSQSHSRQVTYVCPPVGEWKNNAKHRMLITTIPRLWQPWKYRSKLQPSSAHIRQTLRQAWQHNHPNWKQFETQAQKQLASLETPDMNHVNQILVDTTLAIFDAPRPIRTSSWQHALVQQPAQHLWSLYRNMQQTSLDSFHGIFTFWKLRAQFRAMGRSMKHHGRNARQKQLDDFLQSAATKADRYDTHGWYKDIKQLCPKQPFRPIHMRDESRRAMSPDAELKMIVDYFSSVFRDDTFCPAAELPALKEVPFTVEEISQALKAIPASKALAHSYAPAVSWKGLADTVAPLIWKALEKEWCGTYLTQPTDWTTCSLCLLSKPNKTPDHPSRLRPLALQSPVGKILNGLLSDRTRPYVAAALNSVPQFAYLAGRSTLDCHLRVFEHIKTARALVRNLGQELRSSKRRPASVRIQGGLQIAIDLSQAFDKLSRRVLLCALKSLNLPEDLMQLWTLWQRDTCYEVNYKQQFASFQASRGIQQGSKSAPLLWSIAIHYVLTTLAEKIGWDWIRCNMTVYADDIHIGTVVRDPAELTQTLHTVGIVLQHFQTLCFEINYSKSAALWTFAGTHSGRYLAPYMKTLNKQKFLCLNLQNNMQVTIPLVQKTEYLGAVLTYHGLETNTLEKRLKAARVAFKVLRPWFRDRKHHSLKQRLELWRACVWSTAQYSLLAVGLSKSGVQKLCSMACSQLRQICGDYPQLTHKGNNELFAELGIAAPWILLEQAHQNLTQSLAQRLQTLEPHDICHSTPGIPPLVLPLRVDLDHVQDSRLRCPSCPKTFMIAATLQRHLRHEHQYFCLAEDVFEATRDSKHGMTTCAHCENTFSSWHSLQNHINTHNCPAFSLHTQHHVPIIERQDILQLLSAHAIPQVLARRDLLLELQHHCAICGKYVHATTRMMAHIRKDHHTLSTCGDKFLPGIKRYAHDGNGPGHCNRCGVYRKVARNHSCATLHQLAILQAHALCRLSSPAGHTDKEAATSPLRGQNAEPNAPSKTSNPTCTDLMTTAVIAPCTPDHSTLNLHDHTTQQQILSRGTKRAHHDTELQPTKKLCLPSQKISLFPCRKCPFVALTLVGVELHRRTRHEVHLVRRTLDITCLACDMDFQPHALQIHYARAHGTLPSTPRPFQDPRDMRPGTKQCAHCLTVYGSLAGLRKHIETGKCVVLQFQALKQKRATAQEKLDTPCWSKLEARINMMWRFLNLVTHMLRSTCPLNVLAPIFQAGNLRLSYDDPIFSSDWIIRQVSFMDGISHIEISPTPWLHGFWIGCYLGLNITAAPLLLTPLRRVNPLLLLTRNVRRGSQDGYDLRGRARVCSPRCLDWSLDRACQRPKETTDFGADTEPQQSYQDRSKCQYTGNRDLISQTCLETRTCSCRNCCELRVHAIHASWRGLRGDSDARDLQKVASRQRVGISHAIPPTTHVLGAGQYFAATCAQGRRVPKRSCRQQYYAGKVGETANLELRGEMAILELEPQTKMFASHGRIFPDHSRGAMCSAQTPTTCARLRDDLALCCHEASPTRGSESQWQSSSAVEAFGITASIRPPRVLPPAQAALLALKSSARALSPSTSKHQELSVGRIACEKGVGWKEKLMSFAFINASNHCYVNAACIGYLWATLSIPESPRVVWGTLHERISLLFHETRGSTLSIVLHPAFEPEITAWSLSYDLDQQQDVGEFTSLLMQSSEAVLFLGRWQARLAGSLEDSGSLTVPLAMHLPRGNQNDLTLQTIVNSWHEQHFLYALTSAPALVCIQLQRFLRPGWKDQTCVHFDRFVSIPVFAELTGTEVIWQTYSVTAMIFHQGDTLHCGHYQCVCFADSTMLCSEDHVPMFPIQQTEHLERSIYLIWVMKHEEHLETATENVPFLNRPTSESEVRLASASLDDSTHNEQAVASMNQEDHLRSLILDLLD